MELPSDKVEWPKDTSYWYSLWSLGSFIVILFSNHLIAPLYFEHRPSYQQLTPRKKVEWSCRIGSSLHAIVVCFLSIFSLILEREQWTDPITTVPRLGCIALAISIGYMFADSISMCAFQKGLELILFTIHHIIVAICFGFLLTYRLAPNYGILRLTCEVSTPFLNQRWFMKTMGGVNSERNIAKITLIFAVLFFIGRYFLSIPYWYIFVVNYNSPIHHAIESRLPSLTNFFIMCPGALDCINIVWGIPVLAIAKKAVCTLSTIDNSSSRASKPPVEEAVLPKALVSNGNSCHGDENISSNDTRKRN